jgi:hypothetical protein
VDRVLEHVIVKDDSLRALEDNVEFVISLDSTSIRRISTRPVCRSR